MFGAHISPQVRNCCRNYYPDSNLWPMKPIKLSGDISESDRNQLVLGKQAQVNTGDCSVPFHPKRKSYPHTFCLSFWQSFFWGQTETQLSSASGKMFLRRWLSPEPRDWLPSNSCRRNKNLFQNTANSKEGNRRDLKCSSPSWIKWEEVGAQRVPVSSQVLWPGKWDGLEEVRSPQQSVAPPRTLQLAHDLLILCLLLTGAVPADASPQGRGLEATPDRQTRPRLVLQHPGHQPQLGIRDKPEVQAAEMAGITYPVCVHREEQPEHQTLSNTQYFRHYEHCWWKICSCY